MGVMAPTLLGGVKGSHAMRVAFGALDPTSTRSQIWLLTSLKTRCSGLLVFGGTGPQKGRWLHLLPQTFGSNLAAILMTQGMGST